ncbi:MAG: glycoside hydrolase family 18 protein [Candidatus Marinimicrobia bacterium]|nr:glycoside hydrolase family 18 protein [Candidatus Neomarinimicrobiota bacterium]MBT4129557.1 glycoside hydrolase family 18 protein [Candidatus Neomarinimicrobiota bacterium]MBT4295917.1 glycoside hydrolase family 18 protein [Candidatus Neomarinimicrobiota bacterium]MBT4994250.1 glycoside hydrolase family 18 protein [Candidatus Neomarinimicrobiota bacterium]MBT5236334.1 glycoside hydrolase family 18 protein [Candidatus Neomarinimicrobiota bacterium]
MKYFVIFSLLLLSVFSCSLTSHTESISLIPVTQSVKPNSPEITAFWWNGGWDHYDSDYMKYLDEFIIFAVAPNPETGEIFVDSVSSTTGEIFYRRNSGPGLSTGMLKQITADADKYQVRKTLGINGMGKKRTIFNALVENGHEKKFALEILTFCQTWGIQNVDVDYEHPNDDHDVAMLTAIIRALYDQLNPAGIGVSVTVGPNREFMQKFVRNNHQYLSQINLMSYLQPYKNFVKWLEFYHNELSVPREKLYGGIGFYIKKQGKPKESYDYREFVDWFPEGNIPDEITLDDPDNPENVKTFRFNNSHETLSNKIQYVKDEGYGGIMIWAINHDLPMSDDRAMLRYVHSEVHK